MPRPDKATAVAALTEQFSSASAAVLTEYRGLTVAQLTALRQALGADATYAIVKNTLTRLAARNAGLDSLEPLLAGPSAIAFVTGDPVAVAKGLRDFARANPFLVVKGGVLDGKAMSAEEIRRLADLESREVLLARMAGALQGALGSAASLFQAPLARAARLAEALRQQRSEQPGDGAAAEPAPAAAESAPS
jgi:large subunit ribosomal protein L10